jgi:4-hydroxybutyrate CoA-transferase
MNWMDDYKSKCMSAEDAVARIQSGNCVYYAGNAATPKGLVRALAQRRDELCDVQLNHVLLLGDDPLCTPDRQGHFRHNSLFVGPADRKAVNDGRADYVPVFLHMIPRLFKERIIPLDVAMLHLSPPDEHGFMSLGVETLAAVAAAQSAKTVIAQVNDRMPRVLGDCFIHVNRVAAIVEHSEPLPERPAEPATEIEKAIARNTLPLIPPGATMQMGIGGIPDSVFECLEGNLELGIHTEMFSDGAMKAIERGVVTGTRKSLHAGKVVITFAWGTTQLYDFLDNNPLIEAHPVSYVNDPEVIARNDNLVAVNSAIEVDLTGQVCSDSIGSYIFSGFGGQVDFIRGAARSRGGRPIIAMQATAKNGLMSRIVPYLKEGAGVVTSRADVHYVVTEFGAANLFGKNLRERALALIGIADPKFRDDLERAAKARRLI